MPDTRTQRGPHPKDRDCFASQRIPKLRRAVAELSWLLSRGYSERAALKLVGDRHSLRDRQRLAMQRTAAGDEECARRAGSQVFPEALEGASLAVDGYNLLLTLEAALSGGLLLLARDGTMRDLASMSGHYKRVATTRRALDLTARALDRLGCKSVAWYLDRPVSNSGRLAAMVRERTERMAAEWIVEPVDQVDRLLAESERIVVTADSAILDRCRAWFNLARHLVEGEIPEAWIVDLSSS